MVEANGHCDLSSVSIEDLMRELESRELTVNHFMDFLTNIAHKNMVAEMKITFKSNKHLSIIPEE